MMRHQDTVAFPEQPQGQFSALRLALLKGYLTAFVKLNDLSAVNDTHLDMAAPIACDHSQWIPQVPLGMRVLQTALHETKAL